MAKQTDRTGSEGFCLGQEHTSSGTGVYKLGSNYLQEPYLPRERYIGEERKVARLKIEVLTSEAIPKRLLCTSKEVNV